MRKDLEKVLAMGCLVAAALTVAPGCENKEELVDIETPAGEVEIERNKDTGEVDVDVTRNKAHDKGKDNPGKNNP